MTVGMWKPEEDELLLRLIQQHGRAWLHISKQMNAQRTERAYTENMIRNRYLRIEVFPRTRPSRNRCRVCGMFKRGHTCRPSPPGSAPFVEPASTSEDTGGADPSPHSRPMGTPCSSSCSSNPNAPFSDGVGEHGWNDPLLYVLHEMQQQRAQRKFSSDSDRASPVLE